MQFSRLNTDGRKVDVTLALNGSCLSSDVDSPATCFIMGAGPSLGLIPETQREEIQRSAAAKFSVNYGGWGKDGEGWLIKPNYWTTYDATHQFSRCILQDPSITKFVKHSRSMDLATGTTEKLCDCPNTYFMDLQERPYSEMFDTRSESILDAGDSFLMAVDVAIKLGYRRLYLIGTEMQVPVSEKVREHALAFEEIYKTYAGIHKDLWRIAPSISEADGSKASDVEAFLDTFDNPHQYSMSEVKSIHARCRSDKHYWEIVQRFRLGKRSLAETGVSVYSLTENSRLNDWFEYVPVSEALETLEYLDSRAQSTKGVYQRDKGPSTLGYNRDIRHFRREVVTANSGAPNPQLTPRQLRALEWAKLPATKDLKVDG